jgi:hypothetical protein
LADRRLRCPDRDCLGVLRAWGWAQQRAVNTGVRNREEKTIIRPRRGRCACCGVTHVLLPVGLLSRRRDGGAPIRVCLEGKAEGHGYRTMARVVDRPPTTVRDWFRAAAFAGTRGSAAFTGLLTVTAPDPPGVWPRLVGDATHDLVAALMAGAAGWAARPRQPRTNWLAWGTAACRSQLLCRGWWRNKAQHEFALTGPVGVTGLWGPDG